jgi:hypothetical protein
MKWTAGCFLIAMVAGPGLAIMPSATAQEVAQTRAPGVQIMTPAYEGDPETPKIAPRESWFAPPARPADAEGDSRS